MRLSAAGDFFNFKCIKRRHDSQWWRMEAALEQSAWRRQAPDLSGRWERDSSQNVEDCIAFLEAHGHDTATAVSKVLRVTHKDKSTFFCNHALHVVHCFCSACVCIYALHEVVYSVFARICTREHYLACICLDLSHVYMFT